MDINLLVLNAGNSRVALGVFSAGQLVFSRRVEHEKRAQWPDLLAEAWRMIQDAPNAAVAGASVDPQLSAQLDQAVRQATQRSVQWVGDELELPIEVLTDQPTQTGVDRVLNIVAAFEQMQKPCVVVDAGTAITLDACDEKGRFVGGVIAPGARLMLDSMNRGTARLPAVAPAVPAEALGKNTAAAMQAGVYYALRGLVREFMESWATQLGHWPDLIATGGDAELLFKDWELLHAIAPDLTLYGIALAYTEHHIKYD